MADSYFPEIEPTITEKTMTVDLNKFGVDIVARLKARSNFSDFVPTRDDKSDKLAEFYAAKFGCKVEAFTVRLANQIVAVWDGPNKENGKPPTAVDFIKLSIANKEAFAELVNYATEDSMADDVDALVNKATENFTVTEMAGGG